MDIKPALEDPAWLETEAFGGFRVWQIIFLCLGAILSVVIMLCCCFRFRIPRTKQDIEADYQRKRIAKKFREKLACIQNSEMDDMDLRKGEKILLALDRVREGVLAELQKEVEDKKVNKGMSQQLISTGGTKDFHASKV